MVKEDEASYGGSEIETIINHSKADGTYMKAPNGQPTNLNEKQWVQVRTKAFKKWFGDWELANLYNRALTAWNDKNSKGKVVMGLSERAKNRFGELLGTNVKQLVITDDAIRHIKKKHGEREELRGQKNMTPEDVVVIPYLINNFDSMELNPKENDNKGNRAIEIRKRINGVSVIATIERGENKEFLVTSYQYVRSDALDVSNETPGLNVRNDSDIANVQKEIEEIKSSALNSSKVVNENGEPMVMYHGTASDITSFDMYDGSLGKGAYFTSSWDEAAEYAMEKQGVDNIDELDESKVMEVFLNVRDEKNITHSRFSREDIEVLATSPTQIKSATENNGDFSGENLDIRYSLREKPRRKPGESLISYHRRVEEWKTEWEEAKRRREVETMGRNEFDDNKGNRAVTIRKRINGVSVIATIERGENKEFLVTSYQYVRSDALDASNETPGLNVQNDSDIANVQKEIEEIKSSALNSSKVVDANGEPLVVYHSGASDIKEFSHEYDKTGIGSQIRGG